MTPTIQERTIADRLRTIFGRGRRQPGSGNTAIAPNDVAIPGRLHVEAKLTCASSFLLKWETIQKASKLALQFAVPSVLAIRFAEHDKHDYFVVQDDMFYDLLDSAQRLETVKDTFLPPVVK